MLPCNGVVVFNKTGTKCITVFTHKGHGGFPKGKREKKDASPIDAALRELKEETGIDAATAALVLAEDVMLIESSRKGTPSIGYLVGRTEVDPSSFRFDPDELERVCWTAVDDVMRDEAFADKRKAILDQARAVLNDTAVVWRQARDAA